MIFSFLKACSEYIIFLVMTPRQRTKWLYIYSYLFVEWGCSIEMDFQYNLECTCTQDDD